ncbi:Phage integrase family protein [Sporobacter termitidis DSM 10068]|uniref:Phage integrase family protein n=1 Tax=Sporobacter termitidis DSM 10068 TaxID=1123282 RepID=A0A1M5W5U3_9FIRM|nr:site-specific integrase [Sporobacter termitidis]SHH82847.1 Phage integrase family protein [Sporobacter termitidis DSM 10068]
MAEGQENYTTVACLSYYAGLRIHECFRIDTATAEAALRDGTITIKGKGGKIRSVPLSESIHIELRKLLDITPRGHKLFVPDGVPTDRAIAYLQTYIAYARNKIRDEGSVSPLTHHGLRHSFAANKYRALTAGGMTPLEASLEVSRLLGHERADVTRIYLALLQKDGGSNG